jgi:MinD superfamily P-loop ATPase
MKELVVISGKGGSGKTSLVASFAALARNKVMADCDVDAADLHLVLAPVIERREVFKAGKKARVRPDACVGCGVCAEHCVFEAVSMDGPANGAIAKTYRIDEIACEGCGVCLHVCPAGAIEFTEPACGEWFVSRTRFGPLVHAKLGVAQENSGKLVYRVRTEARDVAKRESLDLVIIDGPPGIGCPVIASMTGANLALAVTEPTPSGLHDLQRVQRLAQHFRIPMIVCINKYDINVEMSDEIERKCRDNDVEVVGRIRYAPEVTQAQIAGQSVIEYGQGAVVGDVERVWREVEGRLRDKAPAAGRSSKESADHGG